MQTLLVGYTCTIVSLGPSGANQGWNLHTPSGTPNEAWDNPIVVRRKADADVPLTESGRSAEALAEALAILLREDRACAGPPVSRTLRCSTVAPRRCPRPVRAGQRAKIRAFLDAGRRQEISARNEADTVIHLAQRALALRREDLTPDIAAIVESKVARLRAVLRGGSVMRIQIATQELKAALPAPFFDTAERPADAEARVGAGGLRSEPLER